MSDNKIADIINEAHKHEDWRWSSDSGGYACLCQHKYGFKRPTEAMQQEHQNVMVAKLLISNLSDLLTEEEFVKRMGQPLQSSAEQD